MYLLLFELRYLNENSFMHCLLAQWFPNRGASPTGGERRQGGFRDKRLRPG